MYASFNKASLLHGPLRRQKVDWRLLPLMCSTCTSLGYVFTEYSHSLSSSLLVRSVRRSCHAVLTCRSRMQFADKTTLGQSAVLGILYVLFL